MHFPSSEISVSPKNQPFLRYHCLWLTASRALLVFAPVLLGGASTKIAKKFLDENAREGRSQHCA